MFEPVFSPLYPIIATPGRGRTWSGLRTGVNYKLSAECNEAMDRLGADTAQYRHTCPDHTQPGLFQKLINLSSTDSITAPSRRHRGSSLVFTVTVSASLVF